MHSLQDIRRIYGIRDLLDVRENKRTMVCPLPQHHHTQPASVFSLAKMEWSDGSVMEIVDCTVM
jgi:hypothetical protein